MTLLFALACSLGVTAFTPCSDSLQCREAFGFGSVCGDDGFCDSAVSQDRCDAVWPEDLLTHPEAHAGVLLVGSLYDHGTDIPEKQSTSLAIQQVDESQGVGGAELGLVQCSYADDASLDDLPSEDAAVAMADWLVNRLGAFALVGPATSGLTEAVYTGVDGPLIVSPTATSPALTFRDQNDHPDDPAGRLWRTAPPDSLQGAVLATLVTSYLPGDAQHVALVYQNGSYGEGLAQVFVDQYATADHVVDRLPFGNDTQRNSAASAAATPGIDAILFISSDLPDITAFLQSLSVDADAANTPLFLADAARDTELFATTASTEAARLYPNIVGTAPAVPSGDRYDAFAAAYAATYEGESAGDSSYSAYAYDAAWLVAYGAAWALANEDGLSGQNAANGLRHLSDPLGAAVDLGPVAWSQALASINAGEDVDVNGASGMLDYDPQTEETSGPIEVWGIVDDGEPAFVVLDTVAP